jgi:hypothetical protein
MWVFLNEEDREVHLTTKNDGTDLTYDFRRLTNKNLKLEVKFANGDTFYCPGVNQLTAGAWHYLTTTVRGNETGSELHIFLDQEHDCKQFADSSNWQFVDNGSHPLIVGGMGAPGSDANLFSGFIYEYRIWYHMRGIDEHLADITSPCATVGPWNYACSFCPASIAKCLPVGNT